MGSSVRRRDACFLVVINDDGLVEARWFQTCPGRQVLLLRVRQVGVVEVLLEPLRQDGCPRVPKPLARFG